MRALRREEWVMIESNSILGYIEPALYLFVLDPSRSDFKASARKYLEKADALVTIGSSLLNHPWPDIDAGLLTNKPSFHLAHPDETSDDLIHFVGQKLHLDGAALSSPN
jgi:hypothetical protein